MLSLSNQDILHGIKNCDDELIVSIYDHLYPIIENFTLNNSGSKEDAKDLFQEGMLVIFRKISDDELFLRCKFSTFFHQICKNIWLNELKRRSLMKKINSELYEDEQNLAFKPYIEDKQYNLFLKHLNKIRSESKNILKLHFSGKSIIDIMKITGINNKQVAHNKKYRCKKELRDSIVNDPEFAQLKDEILITN
jgi:RNA polymerase sigma factor (sigma-70 family)